MERVKAHKNQDDNGKARKNGKEFDYSDTTKLLLDREVIVCLKNGTNLDGQVRFVSEERIVLVKEPTSALDLTDFVAHNIVNAAEIAFIQFKTPYKQD